MNVGRYLRGEDRHVGTARTTKNKEKNPMGMPLPCDVKVGHVTIRKGVALSVLIARMQVLYDMAQHKLAQPEQPAQQKPLTEEFNSTTSMSSTSPPQRTWVGLTDEKIEEIAAKTLFPVPFARAIEAAHGIKENT